MTQAVKCAWLCQLLMALASAVLAQGMTCANDKCVPSFGKCGGWYWVNGKGDKPRQKRTVRQCCDPNQECVQFRHNYYQCRPKQRPALRNWNGTVHVCTKPAATTPAPSPPPAASGLCNDPWIAAAVAENNKHRKAFGIAPVACHEKASTVAEQWSEDMCKCADALLKTKSLSHDGFSDRCSEIGYRSCAENVLYNFNTDGNAGEAAMTQWYNSEGHRNNLMNKDYTKVGYGYFKCSDGRVYWTGMYGK